MVKYLRGESTSLEYFILMHICSGAVLAIIYIPPRYLHPRVAEWKYSLTLDVLCFPIAIAMLGIAVRRLNALRWPWWLVIPPYILWVLFIVIEAIKVSWSPVLVIGSVAVLVYTAVLDLALSYPRQDLDLSRR